MKYTAENGVVLDDAKLDKLAEEWESGQWAGHLGEITMGRPKLYDEDLGTVSFKLPKSRIAAIEQSAKQRGITKSEFLRDAVDRELIALAS
jgi:hypothetical protein